MTSFKKEKTNNKIKYSCESDVAAILMCPSRLVASSPYIFKSWIENLRNFEKWQIVKM